MCNLGCWSCWTIFVGIVKQSGPFYDPREKSLTERKRRQRLRGPHGGGRRSGARRRLPWAALLPRVLAAIHDPAPIARVLGSLGLSGAEPVQAGCLAPPDREERGADGGSGWPE